MHGLRAVITGGGSGIGRAIATAFAREGAEVLISGRSAERLEAAAAEIGSGVRAVPTDVTVEADVRRLFEIACADGARLDVLVNSAGAFAGGVVDDLSLEDWQTVMDVNVTGTFLCSRQAFRHMRPHGRGRILTIGSIAGSRVREHSAAYSTSKHAVWGLTQALALDGRDDGIAVTCLNPGNTLVERRADGVAVAGRDLGPEPMMATDHVARLAVLTAALPPDVTLLEATLLPVAQRYVGRG
ncbi:SDR family oxidoreductase [Nocardioides terrae]|uniref:SDR family oxidoreductase n=1 Tax=Nocardioides terrae TaxID=574651 RepID=UPI001C31E477|nr:SDR family oxidoreductase [Nocardioides terrae]